MDEARAGGESGSKSDGTPAGCHWDMSFLTNNFSHMKYPAFISTNIHTTVDLIG